MPGWAILAGVGIVLGLIAAPLTCHRFDVLQCWLPWARATGGLRPWDAYGLATCNYPPAVLYVLTVMRRAQMIVGLPVDGTAGVVAVKLPGLIAYAATAWVCAAGLAPVWGKRSARSAATAAAVCLPVWFNAAVWGQWDALLCLALVGSVVAAIRDRPVLSGVAAGVGLSIKLQAIVLLPTLAVYGFRRWGVAGVAKGVAATAVAWAVVVGPTLALGGQLAAAGLRTSYVGAVDSYPFKTIVAFNVWMVGETATPSARDWNNTFGHGDGGRFLGPLTAKQVGLGLFAADAAVLLAALYRRPTPARFALAAGLLAFGFFMLPTQMHDRYVLPACGLLAVAAGPRGGWKYFLVVCGPALFNQAMAMAYENAMLDKLPNITTADIAPYQTGFLVVSLANVVALVLATVWFLRDGFAAPAARPA